MTSHHRTPVATKRTKKRHSRTSAPETPETAEHMIDRVLGAFDRWLAQREPDPQRFGDTAGIVRIACDMKSDYLGEPNPADWSPATAAEVVGQVIPRKVVGVDDRYIATLVPAIRASAKFGFDFLTCGDAARHAGDGGLLGGHGPGDDHEGSSGHMPNTKDHARC